MSIDIGKKTLTCLEFHRMQLNVTYSLTCFVAKAPIGKAVFGVTYPVAALGATKCTTLAVM
jgi:hypothetical protein